MGGRASQPFCTDSDFCTAPAVRPRSTDGDQGPVEGWVFLSYIFNRRSEGRFITLMDQKAGLAGFGGVLLTRRRPR